MSERFTLHTAIMQSELEDSQRAEFLIALDKAAHEVNVTEFEAKFIGDFLAAPSRWIWTGPRRHVVGEMMCRYAHRIPTKTTQTASPRIPETESGRCGWLYRNAVTGKQGRCGQPAVAKTERGLELCAQHKTERDDYLARQRDQKARRR